MKNKILIICHGSTFFTELYRVAEVIKDSSYTPWFLFHSYPTAKRDIDTCLNNQITCLDQKGNIITQTRENKPSTSPLLQKKTIKSYLKQIIKLLPFWNILSTIKDLRRQKNQYSLIITEHQPNIIILGGDQVGYDTPLIIQEGHNHKIPTLIIPSTMSDGTEQAEVYYYDPSYHVKLGINYLAAIIYPRWVKTHQNRKLLRVPGARLIAMEYLKLSPPLPWIFNSGFGDAIAVESNAMLTYYSKCGLSEHQLRITGSPADDILFHHTKNYTKSKKELCDKLNLPEGLPIILTALPPDSLYMLGGRPQCDFQEYEKLVQFWLNSLGDIENYSIIVSLHPSIKYEEMKHIEQFNVKISTENIVRLIPICDIFVASVSSTIRWAISCNKPVINYDVYRYRYTDFINIEGVFNTEDQTDFLSFLKKITGDKTFYNKIKINQEQYSKKWGILDGKSGKRILKLIDNLVD